MDRLGKTFLLLAWDYFKKRCQYRQSRRRFLNQIYRQHLTSIRFNYYILSMQNVILISDVVIPSRRRFWALNYEQNWFESMWDNRQHAIFSEFWYKEFRMKPDTFEFIVRLVSPNMSKKDTTFRRAVAVEKRVAVAIWRLSTGNSYRTASKVFGIAKSTVIKVTIEFVQAILQFTDQFIQFPQTELETSISIEKFKEIFECELPQVVGAIDATHVEILAPSNESRVDYFSRKQKYTVVNQGVVGANLIFLDFVSGFPGSIHDSRALRATELFRKAEANEVLNMPVKVVQNMNVRPIILGDGAYPASTWLLKPYPFHNNLTQEQKRFNRVLSSSRCVAENAFGLLKSRWRCLMKRIDNNLENISGVVMSCVILHNICQKRKDEYIDDDQVLDEVI